MATLSELEQALVEADYSGDKEAVQALSEEILRMREAQTPAPSTGSKLKGVLRGVMDPLVGLTQASVNLDPLKSLKDRLYTPVEEMTGIPLTAKGFNRSIREGEKEYQTGRGATGLDFPRLAGNIVSPLNVLLGSVSGPGMAGNLLAGASSSMVQPSYAGEGDYSSDKLNQLGVGTLAGGAAGAVGTAFGKLVSPKVPKDIQTLREMGVTPTIGQRLGPQASKIEEGLTSVPLLGSFIRESRNRTIEDFNRGLGNQVLKRVGQTLPDDVPAGHAMISHLERTLGENYDNLLPHLVGRADNQFQQEMGDLQTAAMLMPQNQSDQFNRILQTQVFDKFTPQGNASGETLKEIEHQLGYRAHGYMKSQDFDQQTMGRALREAQRILRNMIERNNPSKVGELQNANSAWADFLRLEKAASKAGKNEGVFTPGNFLQATKDLDPTRRKAQFARGEARLQDEARVGQRVLKNMIPDSGTAYRSMLGLGMLGGLGYATEDYRYPLLASMAMLPYTRSGQRTADLLLSGGNAWREPLRTTIERVSPLMAATGAIGAVSTPTLTNNVP